MNQGKSDELVELFEDLLAICSRAENENAIAISELIQQSLKIIALISEQSYQVYGIARMLCVVPGVKHKNTLGANLRHDLQELEKGLEPRLRGFSKLFDLALQDTILTIDVEKLRLIIPGKYKDLMSIFFKLHRRFEAYYGLDQALVPTILFLRALQEVMTLSIPSEEEEAREAIINWLLYFVKNSELSDLFSLPLYAL